MEKFPSSSDFDDGPSRYDQVCDPVAWGVIKELVHQPQCVRDQRAQDITRDHAESELDLLDFQNAVTETQESIIDLKEVSVASAAITSGRFEQEEENHKLAIKQEEQRHLLAMQKISSDKEECKASEEHELAILDASLASHQENFQTATLRHGKHSSKMEGVDYLTNSSAPRGTLKRYAHPSSKLEFVEHDIDVDNVFLSTAGQNDILHKVRILHLHGHAKNPHLLAYLEENPHLKPMVLNRFNKIILSRDSVINLRQRLAICVGKRLILPTYKEISLAHAHGRHASATIILRKEDGQMNMLVPFAPSHHRLLSVPGFGLAGQSSGTPGKLQPVAHKAQPKSPADIIRDAMADFDDKAFDEYVRSEKKRRASISSSAAAHAHDDGLVSDVLSPPTKKVKKTHAS